jgi:dihydropteroate synthase
MSEIKLAGRVLKIEEHPLIMGVLNVTPDSFYEGSRFSDPEKAVERALVMLDEGADLIDIGGESTRPGAEPVPPKEELKRIEPVLKGLFEVRPKCVVSVDTRRPEVAERALSLGASIINEVGGMGDPTMRKLAKLNDAAVVIMHMKGDPKNMQETPSYEDVIWDVLMFLKNRAEACTEDGIDPKSIIIDPGIGFGKRVEDNLKILANLDIFGQIGYPLLVGVSRKSFIGRITGRDAGDRLAGSVAANVIAMLHGAEILRVHDVKETKDALLVAKSIISHK